MITSTQQGEMKKEYILKFYLNPLNYEESEKSNIYQAFGTAWLILFIFYCIYKKQLIHQGKLKVKRNTYRLISTQFRHKDTAL